MWRAITKALEIVPQLIGQLPAAARAAAAAAWLFIGMLCVVATILAFFLMVPIDAPWGQQPVVIALLLLGLYLIAALVVCVTLVVIGVIRRFFGHR